MLTIPIKDYNTPTYQQYWQLPCQPSADGTTVTIYQAGDTLPPELQVGYVDPSTLPPLTLDDVINLLQATNVLTSDQVTAVQTLKLNTSMPSIAQINQAITVVATPPAQGAAQPAPAIPAAG